MASTPASAGGTDRDLAAPQFCRNCCVITFILLYLYWASFQTKQFTKQPRVDSPTEFEFGQQRLLRVRICTMRAAVSRLLWKPYAVALPVEIWLILVPSNPDLRKTIDVLTVSMPQKLKLNQRLEFKTWRFTGTLTPTHHISEDIHWIATNNIAVLEPHILLVKACIRQKIMK